MSLLISRWKGQGPGRTRRGEKQRAGRNRRTLSLEMMETRTLMTGTITPLANSVPDGSGTMMLETNGDVIMQAGGDSASNEYYVLAPDAQGNYVDGTWTEVASTELPRLFNGSVILPNGQMMVVGGEYSGPDTDETDTNEGEIYTPSTNTWAPIATFPQPNFGDDMLVNLENGLVLAGYLGGPQTYLYNPSTNVWTQTGTKLNDDQSDEEGYTELPDGSFLDYDIFSSINDGVGEAQRYYPSTGKWVATQNLPGGMQLSSAACGYELGGGMLLPDGQVFWIGGNGDTAYYNPSTNAWTAGPAIPDGLVQDDAPVAELPSGKILLTADQIGYTGPTHVFEYDPTAETYTDISSSFPSGYLSAPFGGPAFLDRFLVLPNGQVLMNNSTNNLVLYTPDAASAVSTSPPSITKIAENANGSFTLTGTDINGNNDGATYGDDAQMATNYPIVSFTNLTGQVSYATTYGFNYAVEQGNTPLTTQFTLPTGLAPGTYSVRVIANGVASKPYGLQIPTKLNDPAPTIATPAASSANPVFTTSTKLSVLAADTAGESTLTYNWATIAAPAGLQAPTFSTNNSNAAKNDTVTFYGVGTYSFKVTATNLAGLSVSSTVTVMVQAKLTTIGLSPTVVQLSAGQSEQFSVSSGLDQFGNQVTTSSLSWAITSGGGTVTQSGLYTAPAAGTIATVKVSSGTVSSLATIYVLSNPWTSSDVGTPTLGGDAADNGTGTFTLLGAGTGIAGLSDQFQYTYQSMTGNSTLIAQVGPVQNTGTAAEAGIMYRNDTTANSAYVMEAMTPSAGMVFSYRATSGANAITVPFSKVTGAEYLKIVRSGNTFTGYYSLNGTSWTQAYTTSSVALNGTVDDGLVLTSDSASKINTTIFNHVITDGNPNVVTPASASPSPVTTTKTTLSVLGGDQEGESALTYTWAATTVPPATVAPTFATNGTNASKSDVATFFKAGTYTFTVTIANSLGYSTTSSVSVTVVSTQTTVATTPTTVTLSEGGTEQFVSAVYDQFGLKLAKQPQFTYSMIAGGAGGKVSSTGLYTAPLHTGIDRVNVTGAGTAAVATITVTAFAPSGGPSGLGSLASVATSSLANVGSVAVGFGSSGKATLVTAADGIRLLPAGRQTDLPWANIRTLTVTLSKAEPLSASDIHVTGITVANYGPVSVTPVTGGPLTPGSTGSTSYLITLAEPIATADRVTLTIGNAGITTYTRRIDVLPGDVNDDGFVNSTDATLATGYLATTYSAADIFGDGQVTTKSVKAIQLLNGSTLPTLK